MRKKQVNRIHRIDPSIREIADAEDPQARENVLARLLVNEFTPAQAKLLAKVIITATTDQMDIASSIPAWIADGWVVSEPSSDVDKAVISASLVPYNKKLGFISKNEIPIILEKMSKLRKRPDPLAKHIANSMRPTPKKVRLVPTRVTKTLHKGKNRKK